ncbi:MAG: alpha/beta fold hydrolase [Candidatus Liptonbacteria bacterium]|nr:alpha/beta fold hydrolase [Candidatus Liptonbacteria bacterium]
MQPVKILAGDIQLEGNIFLPPKLEGKAPAILHIHGGGKSAQERIFEMAKLLSAMGFICLAFDRRGHGKSPGNFAELSRKDFLEDCIAAYDFLAKQEGVDKENISVVGPSFGSYLAALLTKEREVSRLVLRVPADYPDEGFETPNVEIFEKSEGPEWWIKAKEWKETVALRALHEFRGPILLIESEKDDVIPHQTVENYKNAVEEEGQLTYVLMKDAPHSLRERPDLQREFEKIVVDWMINQ